MNARLWGPSVVALLLAAGLAGAQPTANDAQALAAKIDQHIAKRWQDTNTQPAALAGDAEFLRRAYLDLAGRIPTVAEARTFLEDKRTDNRARLVDQLLAGPRYVAHFTNVWRALLLPEANNNFQVKLQQGGFESWLKKQVAKNTGYDQMVRELLTTDVGGAAGNPIAAFYGNNGPMPYYIAKELKPENLASATARVFLGVSVECAQCHNHPFAEWKREQFWGFAAFFSGIKANRQMDFLLPGAEEPNKHEIGIPGTDKVIQAKFLDGTDPTWNAGSNTRSTLATWVTSKDNPWFSRALVNRTWAYFMGHGLVEPIDELVGAASTPSHPELLELLAREFANHNFDMKFLIRAVTGSRAYQLTSAKTHSSQDDTTVFGRMPLRGLTGEQLFDSVATATGYRDSGGDDNLFTGLLGGSRSARAEFLSRFAPSERPTEAQTSILQALSLMNGKVTAAATTLQRSELLAAVVDAPFLSTAQRVEALYLATLSRKPTAKETERLVKFVQDAAKTTTGPDYNNALADVFWALLNSPEFVLNH
jgi:hypothetical protein